MMTTTPSQSSDARTDDSLTLPETPSLDVLFDVLAHRRRRYTLECLCDGQTPMALADLAREVSARERGTAVPEIPDAVVKRTYRSLSHSHVPKLADADIVEYNRERKLLALSMESERVEPLVEATGASEKSPDGVR